MFCEEICAYQKDYFDKNGKIREGRDMFKYFVRVRTEQGKIVMKFQFYSPQLNVPFIRSKNVTILPEFQDAITSQSEQDVKSFYFREWDDPVESSDGTEPETEVPSKSMYLSG